MGNSASATGILRKRHEARWSAFMATVAEDCGELHDDLGKHGPVLAQERAAASSNDGASSVPDGSAPDGAEGVQKSCAGRTAGYRVPESKRWDSAAPAVAAHGFSANDGLIAHPEILVFDFEHATGEGFTQPSAHVTPQHVDMDPSAELKMLMAADYAATSHARHDPEESIPNDDKEVSFHICSWREDGAVEDHEERVSIGRVESSDPRGCDLSP